MSPNDHSDSDVLESSFSYGWCVTDHKDGKEIRPFYRTADYLQEEPYATSVKAMLKKLGLPLPKPEEIFRGTRHDLLFLNSHGVVLRIGPTDVMDMINPGILQPLGWMEDPDIRIGTEEIPFTVAIYPGIELFKDWQNNMHRPELTVDLPAMLYATGQNRGDYDDSNRGVIRILDDTGREAAVEVILDMDNKCNFSSEVLSEKRANHMARAAEFHENMGDILAQTIESTFAGTNDIQYWQRAFEVHQPLRRLFWEAFSSAEKSDAAPDIKARQKFWDTCVQVTNNPHAAVVPMWHKQTQKSGATEFVREEVFIPQAVLYHPWTGEGIDRTIQPMNVDPAVKAAVQRDHMAKLKGQESKSVVSFAPAKPSALC